MLMLFGAFIHLLINMHVNMRWCFHQTRLHQPATVEALRPYFIGFLNTLLVASKLVAVNSKKQLLSSDWLEGRGSSS